MSQGQRSHGSRSKVTWVKISRWAHVNVKLHFFFIYPNTFRFTRIGESGRHTKCIEGWGEFRSVTYEKQVCFIEMYLNSI